MTRASRQHFAWSTPALRRPGPWWLTLGAQPYVQTLDDLIKRPDQRSAWPAKFASRAAFIGCVGLRDEDVGRRLTGAFSEGWDRVSSLRLDGSPDESCWFAGHG